MCPPEELSGCLSLAEVFDPFFAVSLAAIVTIALYDAFERVFL